MSRRMSDNGFSEMIKATFLKRLQNLKWFVSHCNIYRKKTTLFHDFLLFKFCKIPEFEMVPRVIEGVRPFGKERALKSHEKCCKSLKSWSFTLFFTRFLIVFFTLSRFSYLCTNHDSETESQRNLKMKWCHAKFVHA